MTLATVRRHAVNVCTFGRGNLNRRNVRRLDPVSDAGRARPTYAQKLWGRNMTCFEAGWSHIGWSRGWAGIVKVLRETLIFDWFGMLARSPIIFRPAESRTLPRRRRIAGILRLLPFALSAGVVLLTLAAGLGQARAEYWVGGLPPLGSGNTIRCGDGFTCARANQEGFYGGPGLVKGDCHYLYAGGYLAGALCEGWQDYEGGAARGGIAGLECETGEIRTATGCLKKPPADKDPSPCAEAGNPVDTRSGRKVETALDYSTEGSSPLKFERRYSSDTSYLRVPFGPSRLGRGWRSNFDSRAYIEGTAPNMSEVNIVLPTGEELAFRYSSGAFARYAYDWVDNAWILAGTWTRDVKLVLNTTTQRLELTTEDDTVYSYDYGGLLRTISYRGGYLQMLNYDSRGYNTSVSDSYSRTLTFSYSAQGLLQSITVPGGQLYQYAYLGRYSPTIFAGVNTSLVGLDHWALQQVTKPDTTNVQYHYENAGFPFALTGITNEAGIRFATWTYGADGRVVAEQHAGGVDQYTFSYDDVAGTTTVTNPLSKQSVYHFEKDTRGLPRLKRIEGQPSASCVASNAYLAYNASNFVTDVTDAEGRVTHYVRDARGMSKSITRAYGTVSAVTSTYTWHATLHMPTQIVEPGLTTDLTWNASGQLSQLTRTDTTSHTAPYATNGQVRTWTYIYDNYGNLLTVDGPLAGAGDTVTYAYNAFGFVSSVTNEVGHVSIVTAWNGRGQPTTLRDANGVVWSLAYDDLGRMTTYTTDPSGLAATTTLTYNAVGDITRATRPNGAYLQYTYDDARRVTGVQDNTGAIIEYDRDNMGNVTARRSKDAGGALQFSQTAVFDELGRLLQFVGASNQSWTHGYDRTDNLVSVADPRSNVTGWSFDALNRLIGTTDEEGAAVALTRNGNDEITQYTDPRSLGTGYVRNGFGEVIQRASPDSGTTVYSYNALGKPVQITDARGIVTNLSYDNAGRLLTKQYPAATSENITFTWDSTSGGNKGKGRVTRIQDAAGTVEWTYNSLGQKVQEKKTTGAAIYTIGYGYDLDGNITRITYPSGRVVNYARDAIGRISGVTSTTGAGTVTLADGVTWMPSGSLQSLSYGNGLTQVRTYTQDYQIAQMLVTDTSSGTDVVNRSYGRSDNVNVTDIVDNIDPYRSESYLYTPSGRLENASGPWGVLGYAYDAVGNRILESLYSGGTATEQVTSHETASNHPVEVTSSGASIRAFSHDAAGNLVTDNRSGTSYSYRYNNRGRLDQLTIGSTVTAGYSYDGLDRMAMRTLQTASLPVTMHYVYDLAGHLIAEATAAGVVTREYVWIDDMPLAAAADLETVTPKLWFVHADHLDRPIRMTDSAKTMIWNAFFLPFGAVDVILGTASNNLRFPGQYFLLESGLHYNWHRHYDPTLGRYIQPDPNGEVQATRPINLDSSALTTNRGLSLGSQLPLSVVDLPELKRQLGDELAEFVDGPSIYAYARSAPSLNSDSDGLQVVQAGQAAVYCLRYPALCAATITAAIDACYRTIFSAKAPPKDSSGGDQCDYQYYKVDIPVCRALKKKRGAEAAERCYASAMERYGNCIAGRPMPPLDTWNN